MAALAHVRLLVRRVGGVLFAVRATEPATLHLAGAAFVLALHEHHPLGLHGSRWFPQETDHGQSIAIPLGGRVGSSRRNDKKGSSEEEPFHSSWDRD
jgi:hypothetical protein